MLPLLHIILVILELNAIQNDEDTKMMRNENVQGEIFYGSTNTQWIMSTIYTVDNVHHLYHEQLNNARFMITRCW